MQLPQPTQQLRGGASGSGRLWQQARVRPPCCVHAAAQPPTTKQQRLRSLCSTSVASPQRSGSLFTSSSASSSPHVAAAAAAEVAVGTDFVLRPSAASSDDHLVQPIVNGSAAGTATATATQQRAAAAEAPAGAAAASALLDQQQPHQAAGPSSGEQAAAAAGAVATAAAVAAVAPEDKSAKRKQFMNRVVFGVALGVSGGALITVGQVPFLALLVYITYQATQEFYGFITSQGIAKGMAPPPPLVSSATTALCISMAVLAYIHKGRSSIVLAVSAFLLLVMQVIATKRPKFAQLASSLFGLFYCGWLPSFWVKMRGLAVAAPEIPFTGWIQGFSAWTVGLVATFTTVACVIAADTGAYFVGKSLGRTKLTEISPKKTVEGALGGLASSVGVAVGLQRLTQWPAEPLAAAGLGVLVFFSSLFGDLIESIMKRDAGMKDSGDLIPGHGGLLDRVDSYMFTGAVSYFYIVFILANCGLA